MNGTFDFLRSTKNQKKVSLLNKYSIKWNASINM